MTQLRLFRRGSQGRCFNDHQWAVVMMVAGRSIAAIGMDTDSLRTCA